MTKQDKMTNNATCVCCLYNCLWHLGLCAMLQNGCVQFASKGRQPCVTMCGTDHCSLSLFNYESVKNYNPWIWLCKIRTMNLKAWSVYIVSVQDVFLLHSAHAFSLGNVFTPTILWSAVATVAISLQCGHYNSSSSLPSQPHPTPGRQPVLPRSLL